MHRTEKSPSARGWQLQRKGQPQLYRTWEVRTATRNPATVKLTTIVTLPPHVMMSAVRVKLASTHRT